MNFNEGMKLCKLAFEEVAQSLKNRIVIINGEEGVVLPENYDTNVDPDKVFSTHDSYLASESPVDSDTVFNVFNLCQAVANDPRSDDKDILQMAVGIATAATGSERQLSPVESKYREIAQDHMSDNIDMGYDPESSSLYLWFVVDGPKNSPRP